MAETCAKHVLSQAAIRWARSLNHRAAARIANPLERDAALKRALGFSGDSFTRAADVLRIA